MEPNNAQPINPIAQTQQAVGVNQPLAPENTQPPTQSVPENPKKGSSKSLILLLLLLVLAIGIAAYILFAKSQLNYIQNSSSNNSTVVLPTYIPSPSPIWQITADDLDVGSPEADLQDLEKDLNGL
ncbi:MAG: hypothetical protein HY424_00565 [Candidatus Levybacteria bacterium]|nr:hypothetical protein [Candidatus Levybacteria bacterium]